MDWFPRLRAMSLAADESEGEQIELRSLQTQLETTQKLVSNLTQQLFELREQVTRSHQFFKLKICIQLHFVLVKGHSDLQFEDLNDFDFSSQNRQHLSQNTTVNSIIALIVILSTDGIRSHVY